MVVGNLLYVGGVWHISKGPLHAHTAVCGLSKLGAMFNRLELASNNVELVWLSCLSDGGAKRYTWEQREGRQYR
jgi:hypothetical protein